MGRHRSDFGAMAKPDIDCILVVAWWPRIRQGLERYVLHANTASSREGCTAAAKLWIKTVNARMP
jgi:hypothetical protein